MELIVSEHTPSLLQTTGKQHPITLFLFPDLERITLSERMRKLDHLLLVLPDGSHFIGILH